MSDHYRDGVAQAVPCTQSQIYADHARKALAEAEASALPNVRNRLVTAAKRWIALAQQARRMELRHESASVADDAARDQPA
ncbi:hypothetical protein [Sphingomonas cavernae]|uniref:Uncharacterized protein n=1 Tax=Sphingomonas cavernae TaxID=2320861 RepID=A0A418WLZ2_9SPHN|nr:hypothetical protein [Sphingomonas cavernae]RJF91012.1 hypothetical protein D3876_12745 [Sphingomonas cavernae]